MIRLVPAVSQQPPRHVVVFVHGWTGDEFSMDIFRRELPESYLAMFPRGPLAAPSGYGWAAARQDAWPPMTAFEAPCRDLMKEILTQLEQAGAPDLPLRLVGFSQGGAVCHTLTVLYPHRIERTAVLAGFLPAMADPAKLSGLAGKPYFIAHGQRDETIPIQMAYDSLRELSAAGVEAEFCESSSGHKLALACLKKLQEFITR